MHTIMPIASSHHLYTVSLYYEESLILVTSCTHGNIPHLHTGTPMIAPSIPPNSNSVELLIMIVLSVFICIMLSVCLIAYGICNMVALKRHKQRSPHKSKNSDQTELVCTSNEDSAAVPVSDYHKIPCMVMSCNACLV